MRRFAFLVCLALVGCGGTSKNDSRSPGPDPKVQQLESQISDLQKRVNDLALLADSFTAGVSNPFGDCTTVTDALEKKICQIAQTANASQQLEMKTQLAEMAKTFQVAIFGEDCVDAVTAGCPVAGSLSARLSATEASIAANTASISSIQTSISSINTSLSALTTRVTALETRLNNFNSSGMTIEVLIAGIQSDVSTLKTQMATVQGLINGDRVLQTFTICGDNVGSGPIYEALLLSGDRTKAYGYVKTGSTSGLGLFFSAGQTTTGYNTSLNSKTCHFRMYSTAGKVQACWLSTNRSATDAQIDAARTAATATCTPY